jgi:hypothetical protein
MRHVQIIANVVPTLKLVCEMFGAAVSGRG